MRLLLKYVFVCVSVLLFSYCTDEIDPEINIPENEIENNRIGAYKGDSISLSFSVNGEWTATTTSTWLTVSPASGVSGQIALSFVVNTSNPDTVSRTATVTLASGELTKQLVLVQDGHDDGKVYTLQKAQGVSSGDGVNLVFIGDGFTRNDMGEGGYYDQTMRKAMNYFLSVEPAKTYKDYFNVYEVKAVSEDSVYTYGKSGNTAFSVKFVSESTTEMSGDDDKCFKYALKAIDENSFDKSVVIVVVNSNNWAGTTYFYLSNDGSRSSGSLAYVPMTTDRYNGYTYNYFPLILIHEALGHGLGKLADEYAYVESGNIDAATIKEAEELYSKYGWFANVDFTSDRTAVKWNKFLSEPYYSSYLSLGDTIGVYEGGYTYLKNVWRPEEESCMDNNSPYFNAPSREAIVKRIKEYAGVNYSFDAFYANDNYVPYDRDLLNSLDFYSYIPAASALSLPKVYQNLAPRVKKKSTAPVIKRLTSDFR